MKMLIAYDGSQGADDTLHDFPRAGLSLLVAAPIMSVAEVFAPPAGHTEAAGPVPLAVCQAWAEATQAVEAAHAPTARWKLSARRTVLQEAWGRRRHRSRGHMPCNFCMKVSLHDSR